MAGAGSDAAEGPPDPLAPAEALSVRGSGTVLVVEDDADIRGLLKDLLERRSYHVLEAGDGRAALRLFHEQQPDLVLLDVEAPGARRLGGARANPGPLGCAGPRPHGPPRRGRQGAGAPGRRG